MTLTHFLAILRARAGLALLLFVVTVACAAAVGWLMPAKYTASASLLIDPARADPLAGAAGWSGPRPGYLSTQIDILKSDRVALDVVGRLKLAEQPATRAAWLRATQGQGSIEVWAAQTLQQMLDVKPARDSDIVTVGVVAGDPLLAAQVANAFARAYIDLGVQLRVDPAARASSFFEAQARESRTRLEQAQARLSSFQREKGVVVNDDRLDIESSRLTELSSQLTVMQALVTESGSRQAQAQGASADRLQEVLGNPALTSLRGDLTRAEARLQELNSRLGENHPQVQEAMAQISVLRARLEAETRRVTGSVGVANTINRQRESEIRGSLEAQRAKVMRLKSLRDEGQVLMREVENAQRSYEGVLGRLNQAGLESRATQSNTHLLAEATPPLQPSSPKRVLNLGLAVAVGALVALGAVVVLEALDPRLRLVAGDASIAGVPLFGVLPAPGESARFAARKMPLVRPARSLGSSWSLRRLAGPAKSGGA